MTFGRRRAFAYANWPNEYAPVLPQSAGWKPPIMRATPSICSSGLLERSTGALKSGLSRFGVSSSKRRDLSGCPPWPGIRARQYRIETPLLRGLLAAGIVRPAVKALLRHNNLSLMWIVSGLPTYGRNRPTSQNWISDSTIFNRWYPFKNEFSSYFSFDCPRRRTVGLG